MAKRLAPSVIGQGRGWVPARWVGTEKCHREFSEKSHDRSTILGNISRWKAVSKVWTPNTLRP